MRTTWLTLFAFAVSLTIGEAYGQVPETAPPPGGVVEAPGGAAPDGAQPDQDADEAAPTAGGPATENGQSAISSNPGAVNIITGTGALGRLLGIDPDSGFRLGGLWIGDANAIMTGGLSPGHWGIDTLGLVDFNIDTEKAFGWTGGMFGTQFLQYAGQPINTLAGAFPGFNSLEVTPPFVRSELYQLWYRQTFFNDRLIMRIGKTVPTYDFGNVVRPVPTNDPAASIPAVTGLIFTPVFVNPTMLGKIPGYYNSAVGVTTTVAPTDTLYLSYGFYDGNLAQGTQIGFDGPHFNGYYFHIGEIGKSYMLGPEKKPGNFGIGYWGQTGKLLDFDKHKVDGAGGVYLFGSQRLWFQHPGRDSSGVSGFYQFGANNSNTMLARQYFGTGLTAFGLVPGRPDDSFGFGLAVTWNNTELGTGHAIFHHQPPGPLPLRSSQTMLQWYYQYKIANGVFLQPALTYIPTPGYNVSFADSVAATLRLLILF